MVDRHRPAPVVRAAPRGFPDFPVSRLAVDPPPPAASRSSHEVEAVPWGYLCMARNCDFVTNSLTDVAGHVVAKQFDVR